MFRLHNEVVGIGYLGCLNNLFVCSIVNTKRDIVAERVVKQDGLLIHITNQLAQVKDTRVLSEIVAAFQASPLPIPVVIACVSFLIGMLTGMSQGHVAIVMPIVAAMGTGSLTLAGIAMAFGVAGQMLTPTHMCLVVTIDFFRSDFFGTLKPVLAGEIVLLTIFSAVTYIAEHFA